MKQTTHQNGGDSHSRHSRTSRPSEGQAAQTSSRIYHPAPDGAKIRKGAERQRKAARPFGQRRAYRYGAGRNDCPRNCPRSCSATASCNPVFCPQKIRRFFCRCAAGAVRPATPTCRGPSHTARIAAAAERTDTSAAGPSAPRLCPASCKGCRVSHVGTAVGVSGFTICAIDRKYAAPAHGRCAHPTRTATSAKRLGSRTARADPTCLCPANRKSSHNSAANHAGAVTIAALHSDRTIGRKCTAHSARTAAAAARISDHAAGAGATRVCAAGKEIPRRETVCAGSSSYGTARNPACG